MRFHATAEGTVPFTTEEEVLANINEASWLEKKIKNDIIYQIMELEQTITARRLREAVLGIDSGWLSNVNTRIADLRSLL